jgi:hypothetical protein
MFEEKEVPTGNTSTKAKAEEALRSHHHLSRRKRKRLDRRAQNGASPEEIRASQIASSEKARTEKARIIEKEAAAA